MRLLLIICAACDYNCQIPAVDYAVGVQVELLAIGVVEMLGKIFCFGIAAFGAGESHCSVFKRGNRIFVVTCLSSYI